MLHLMTYSKWIQSIFILWVTVPQACLTGSVAPITQPPPHPMMTQPLIICFVSFYLFSVPSLLLCLLTPFSRSKTKPKAKYFSFSLSKQLGYLFFTLPSDLTFCPQLVKLFPLLKVILGLADKIDNNIFSVCNGTTIHPFIYSTQQTLCLLFAIEEVMVWKEQYVGKCLTVWWGGEDPDLQWF